MREQGQEGTENKSGSCSEKGCAGCSLMEGKPQVKYRQVRGSIQTADTVLVWCRATNSFVNPMPAGTEQESCSRYIRMMRKKERDASYQNGKFRK